MIFTPYSHLMMLLHFRIYLASYLWRFSGIMLLDLSMVWNRRSERGRKVVRVWTSMRQKGVGGMELSRLRRMVGVMGFDFLVSCCRIRFRPEIT